MSVHRSVHLSVGHPNNLRPNKALTTTFPGLHFLVVSHDSIRGCVRPWVRPWVRMTVMVLLFDFLGAIFSVYTALFLSFLPPMELDCSIRIFKMHPFYEPKRSISAANSDGTRVSPFSGPSWMLNNSP